MGFRKNIKNKPRNRARAIWAAMALAMAAAFVLALARRQHPPAPMPPIGDTVGKAIKGAMKADSAKAPSLADIFELAGLEARFERVMRKDTLSKADSAFIMEVDRKLNRMLDEKY